MRVWEHMITSVVLAVVHGRDGLALRREWTTRAGQTSVYLVCLRAGCGKTELAKALAEQMFGEEKYMASASAPCSLMCAPFLCYPQRQTGSSSEAKTV
jgi:hypothetical protein